MAFLKYMYMYLCKQRARETKRELRHFCGICIWYICLRYIYGISSSVYIWYICLRYTYGIYVFGINMVYLRYTYGISSSVYIWYICSSVYMWYICLRYTYGISVLRYTYGNLRYTSGLYLLRYTYGIYVFGIHMVCIFGIHMVYLSSVYIWYTYMVYLQRDEEKQRAAAFLQYTFVAVVFYSKSESVNETCGWRINGEDRKRDRSKYMHREREIEREREREREETPKREKETEREIEREIHVSLTVASYRGSKALLQLPWISGTEMIYLPNVVRALRSFFFKLKVAD